MKLGRPLVYDRSEMSQAEDWSWELGKVDPSGERLELRQGDHHDVVALVGRPVERVFPVRILTEDLGVVDEVTYELDFYLTDVGRPDPWRYAIYHAGTLSNVYSRIHWAHAGSEQ